MICCVSNSTHSFSESTASHSSNQNAVASYIGCSKNIMALVNLIFFFTVAGMVYICNDYTVLKNPRKLLS